jgi:hypothetical protein
MAGRSKIGLFARNGLLGDGRVFVLTIFLPLACVVPWVWATSGKVAQGVTWGLFAKVTIPIEPKFTGPAMVQEAADRLQSASINVLLVFVAVVVGFFALMRT